MTIKIVHKKSSVTGKVPLAADLDYGEIALNYADGKIFYKTNTNSIDYISKGDLLPPQTGNAGKVLSTDGSILGWVNPPVTPANAIQNRSTNTATSGQTTFTISYTPPYIDVFRNGVKLSQGTDYTATSGTNIVLTNPATAGDLIECIAYNFTLQSLNYNDLSNKPTNVSSFTNDAGYLTSITSSQVTTALGFTPYNATNPDGFITSSALNGYLTSSNAAATYQPISGMSSYLTTTTAASTYQTISGMTSYLTVSGANAAYQPLSGMSSYLTTVTAANTYQTQSGMSSYLTTATAASTYQTQSGMSVYLTTATAASTYQTQSGMSSYLTVSGASATYQPLSGMSSYLTTATAASTYQTQSGMSSYLTTATAASTYAPLASPTFTGTVNNSSALTYFGPTKEKKVSVTASTATTTLDLSTADTFVVTVAANTTFAFTNAPTDGSIKSFSIITKNDATAGRAVAFPASVSFAGGQTPPRTTAANGKDLWTLFTEDGTNFVASLSIQNY